MSSAQAVWKIRILCMIAAMAVLAPVSRAAADDVIGAKNSKVFHTHPKQCPAAQQISEENIVRWESEAEAFKEGRRRCKVCMQLDENGGKKIRLPKSPPSLPSKTRTPEKNKKASPAPTTMTGVRVKRVAAGATLHLENGDKVALVGIVAPLSGQPGADETILYLQKLLKGHAVQASPVNGLNGKARWDALGRMMAYVSISGEDSDIGSLLVSEGLAAVDRSADFDRFEEYLKREDDAAWAGRGAWHKLDGADGEASVVIGKHSFEYHLPDCPHVSLLTSPTTIAVNEAKGRRLHPCDHFRLKKDEQKE